MEEREAKEAHVEQLLEEAAEAGLLGWEWAEAHGVAWLAAAYNGIGPEFAGEAIRGKATSALAVFEPAALIHDARNHVSDGTHEAFDHANAEFRYNCLQLADRAYPWWSWKRYRARFAGEALFDFVSSPAGWKAWLDCFDRRNNQ